MSFFLFIVFFFTIVIPNNALTTQSLSNLWSAWKLRYRKSYSLSEEKVRFGIFIENLEVMSQMNAKSTTAKFGLNQFADLTGIEFGMHHTKRTYNEAQNTFDFSSSSPKNVILPDSVDWREEGAVTSVKDQKECGASWAFSAVGAIEGSYFVKNKKLISLSEQQMVDCAHIAGYGCQGGWPYLAVQYAAQQGLESEKDYPFTGEEGVCQFESSKALKVTTGYKFITTKSTENLKAALIDSPVSVLVQADQNVFRFYKSGVVTAGCGATLNHAVLAVGYQKIGLLEAFIVKNSWGKDWGMEGYIFISTIQQINNGQGVCGILAQPIIATQE